MVRKDGNTITLLGPEQFYAFDGTGRICHEFVRYIVQPNGTILAQEIVKRVFDPADGGKELVIHEAVGGETTSELRVSDESLDVGTIEGQWTPWAFGLSFDPPSTLQTSAEAKTSASGTGSLGVAPRHGAKATQDTVLRRHCQPPLGVSEGLESYDVLWEVGEAQSGRLVLQGENDGETARLVLDEIGTTMTKELTDSRTGLRFHQGSTLAASEMQWFPADATRGDTIVRIDEWFGMETDGSRSRPKDARKVEAAAPLGIPRSAVRACVVQSTKGTTGDMHAYLADLFDMTLGLHDAVYAFPTADDTTVTVILDDISEGDSDSTDATSAATLTDEECSSLADDLLFGLVLATGGCGTETTLTVTREGFTGDVSASGGPDVSDWIVTDVESVKTFTYPSPPGLIQLTAIDGEYHEFDHWDGAVSGTNNPVDLILDQDKEAEVIFQWKKILRTVALPGDEGVVKVNGNEVPTSYFLNEGVTVSVSAHPATGSQFNHWAGSVSGNTNPISITMDEDKIAAAIFDPPVNIPDTGGSGPDPAILTIWHSIDSFGTLGYTQDRFAHFCCGTWDWADEEVKEKFVNITCSVPLDSDDTDPIHDAETAHWETLWTTGAQIGLPNFNVEGYWLVKKNAPNYVGDVFRLSTPHSIVEYFEAHEGRQEAVLCMDQQFISMVEDPGPPDKVLWTSKCMLRFIEIFAPTAEDPGDAVIGYTAEDAVSHMITDKDGEHVPAWTPNDYYIIWGWPPIQGKPVTMPNIVGMALDTAIDCLEDSFLTYNTPTYVSSQTAYYPEVIAQDPAATTRVAGGMAVDITVSSTPEP